MLVYSVCSLYYRIRNPKYHRYKTSNQNRQPALPVDLAPHFLIPSFIPRIPSLDEYLNELILDQYQEVIEGVYVPPLVEPN